MSGRSVLAKLLQQSYERHGRLDTVRSLFLQ